jgi:PAS domain S-box-containing protein
LGFGKDAAVAAPSLSFRARIFMALIGIAATASLVIGLVLYYFAESRLVDQEEVLLIRRAQTANVGAGQFLEGLRDPESGVLPAPEAYAEELVRSVADPTGLGVLYIDPSGQPLAARDPAGNVLPPMEAYGRLGLDGLDGGVLRRVGTDEASGGRLLHPPDGPRQVAAMPLLEADGDARGVLVYASSEEGLEETLAYLRYGILGAIAASVLLASAGSLMLARQISRPLVETRDAAMRVASGDYGSSVPVKSHDELGELARAFNYMSEELEHYVGELRREKARLEAVLEASPEAVVAVDAEGRVTMANPAADRMLGVGPGAHGERIREMNVPEGVLACLREATSPGASAVAREVDADGEKTYWAYAARMDGMDGIAADGSSPNGATSAGDGGGAILAVRDITEHRSLEKAKTAFVSDVSHELRTPLTTIQSALDLIQRAGGRLDPLEHRALELADGELKRIRGMVEELLTLARMDSRRYSLEVAYTDLGEVARSAAGGIEEKARRYGIEITCRVEGQEDDAANPSAAEAPSCVCDARKVYQVLLNLLDNAVKYTDPGGRVEVSVFEEGDSAVLRVSDTGVGIPEENLPNLFDRFYRVNKDRSRTTGGSGLGLAISKQIVDLHGGELSVESQVDKGSTFEVRLPKVPMPRSASHAL